MGAGFIKDLGLRRWRAAGFKQKFFSRDGRGGGVVGVLKLLNRSTNVHTYTNQRRYKVESQKLVIFNFFSFEEIM